mgnify:CR=1 FL=1
MAMTFQLKDFDGPLDLLLFLINKEKIDIKDIFVSQITDQYIDSVRNAPDLDMDDATDFLVMAATLLEIKSRAMLPRPPRIEEGEEDPEEALIRRLEEYKRFRETASAMKQFERAAANLFTKLPEEYPLPPPEIEIDGLTLEALWEALKRVQERAPKETEEVVFQLRNIHRENFTVEGCMETIESRLSVGTVRFSQLFSGTPDREEVVTLFMALLELLKLGKAHVMQTGNFGEMTLLPGRRESDLGEE